MQWLWIPIGIGLFTAAWFSGLMYIATMMEREVDHPPENGVTVLAYWRSLGNYNVEGVVCAVYKDGQWYERIEFADDETGEPQFVAIDSSCYMIYSWRLVPEPLTQETRRNL